MKKKVILMVCSLILGILPLLYGKEVPKEPYLFGINDFSEESEDLIFTLIRKCSVLLELKIMIGLRNTFISWSDEENEHCSSVVLMKILERREELIQSEENLAETMGELEILNNSLDELSKTKDIKSFYREFRKSVKNDYPAKFEASIQFYAEGYDMREVFKELFGPDSEEVDLANINDYHDLKRWLRNREGTTEEELAKFLSESEQLKKIYSEKMENFRSFVEKNKYMLKSMERIIEDLHQQSFFADYIVTKCTFVWDEAFCIKNYIRLEAIKSLSEIMPFVNTVLEYYAKNNHSEVQQEYHSLN